MFIELKIFIQYTGERRTTVNVEAIDSLQQGEDGKSYLIKLRGEPEFVTVLEPSYETVVGMLANESLLLEPERFGYTGIAPEPASKPAV